MKVVIVFLAIALLGYEVVAKDETPVDKDKEECIKELKLNHEEMMKLDELDLPPDNNTDFNKLVSCDSKKKGLMSENGEILFDGIQNLLTGTPELKNLPKIQLYAFQKIISVIINTCKSTPMVEDSGKNMIHVHACLYNELNGIKKLLE